MFWRLMLVVVSLVFVSSCQAQAPVAPYQAGTEYFPIDPPVATSAPNGKVEVIEVFSYACIHCAHFQPLVDAWRAKQSKNVVFKYLPAAWNAQWEGFAKAFYAAESLGVLEKTHGPMFKALHEEKKNFASLEDLAQWYAGFGVKPEAFKSAFTSMTTMSGLQHSQAVVPQYGIDGTPSMIVAGKYRVTGQSAGSAEKVFDIVDYLVAKELAAGGKS